MSTERTISVVESRADARRILDAHPRRNEARFVATALRRIASDTGDSIDAVLAAYEAGRTVSRTLLRNDGTATGFLCEALAQTKFEALFPGCTISDGLHVYDAFEKQAGEVDLVVHAGAQVAALGEVKMNPGAVSGGRKKLASLLAGIQSGELTTYRFRDQTYDFSDPSGPFPRTAFATLGPAECFGVTSGMLASPGVVPLQISYTGIERVSSILLHYADLGARSPAPDFDAIVRSAA